MGSHCITFAVLYNWSSFLRATGQISFGHVARASLEIMRLKIFCPTVEEQFYQLGNLGKEVIFR